MQRKIEMMMRVIERPFARDVAREKNRFINKYAGNFLLGIRNDAAAVELHTARIGEIFKSYISKTMPTFAKFQIQSFKSDKLKLECKAAATDLIPYAINQYMTQYGYKRAQLVSKTTYDDIRKVLSTYADQPATDAEIAKEIKNVSQLTAARSAIIARTETHASSQYAVNALGNYIEANLDIEIVKAWVASEDDKTRETHAEMDAGEYIGINDSFIVGNEELLFPGDPEGSAEEVIGCRCISVQEEKQFV